MQELRKAAVVMLVWQLCKRQGLYSRLRAKYGKKKSTLLSDCRVLSDEKNV